MKYPKRSTMRRYFIRDDGSIATTSNMFAIRLLRTAGFQQCTYHEFLARRNELEKRYNETPRAADGGNRREGDG